MCVLLSLFSCVCRPAQVPHDTPWREIWPNVRVRQTPMQCNARVMGVEAQERRGVNEKRAGEIDLGRRSASRAPAYTSYNIHTRRTILINKNMRHRRQAAQCAACGLDDYTSPAITARHKFQTIYCSVQHVYGCSLACTHAVIYTPMRAHSKCNMISRSLSLSHMSYSTRCLAPGRIMER